MVQSELGVELAWVAIVDSVGDCLYKTKVKPKGRMIKWMTELTGVRA